MTDRPATAAPSPARRPADRLHLSPRHRAQLEALLRERLPGVEVWAYGSRITGESHDGSDLDLVLRAPDLREIPIGRLSDLREALRESTIPFLVEARDWARLPEEFQGEIARNHVVLIKAAERRDRDGQLESKSGNVPAPTLGHYYHPPFPGQWHRMPLYSMARWVNGLAFRNITFSSSAVGRPVIKISEIKGGISGQTKFTCQNFDESVRVHAGDLLFSWSGQPETSIDAFWWRGPEGWLNQHIFRVTPSTGIDTVFFFYLLKYLKPSFVSIARNKQTIGLGHVTKRDLENIEAALPDLREQRAIAHVLGALDDKIELNRRMNETLEAMARALFQSWFVDFDPVRAKMEGRDTGLPTEIADLFPDRLVDSEMGRIPAGWRTDTLDAIASLNPESWSTRNAPEQVTYVDLANTKRGHIETVELHSWSTAPSRARRVLRPGDTIVGTVRPGNESYALIGGDGLTASTGFAVLRPRTSNDREIVWCAATSRGNIDRLAHLAGGSAYPAVRSSAVAETRIVLSDGSVRKGFSSITAGWFDRIENNKRTSRKLVALRDALLAPLVSGKLRVPQSAA